MLDLWNLSTVCLYFALALLGFLTILVSCEKYYDIILDYYDVEVDYSNIYVHALKTQRDTFRNGVRTALSNLELSCPGWQRHNMIRLDQEMYYNKV